MLWLRRSDVSCRAVDLVQPVGASTARADSPGSVAAGDGAQGMGTVAVSLVSAYPAKEMMTITMSMTVMKPTNSHSIRLRLDLSSSRYV